MYFGYRSFNAVLALDGMEDSTVPKWNNIHIIKLFLTTCLALVPISNTQKPVISTKKPHISSNSQSGLPSRHRQDNSHQLFARMQATFVYFLCTDSIPSLRFASVILWHGLVILHLLLKPDMQALDLPSYCLSDTKRVYLPWSELKLLEMVLACNIAVQHHIGDHHRNRRSNKNSQKSPEIIFPIRWNDKLWEIWNF